jgi:hypothetical protein
MLKWVEDRLGFTLLLAQGSYTGGAVAASGSTHNGGGAVDARVHTLDAHGHERNLTDKERIRLVTTMKDAGFAVWHREDAPGVWGEHVHGIAFGDKEASGGARSQLLSFDAGRDGLTGNRVDSTYRPKPRVSWNYLLNRPTPR